MALMKCYYINNTCNDNDSCTVDYCRQHECVHYPLEDLDDHNQCTLDTCAAGIVVHTPLVCDDESGPCSVGTCNRTDGQCDYAPRVCQRLTNRTCFVAECAECDSCEDGYECTEVPVVYPNETGLQCEHAVCDPRTGQKAYRTYQDGTICVPSVVVDGFRCYKCKSGQCLPVPVDEEDAECHKHGPPPHNASISESETGPPPPVKIIIIVMVGLFALLLVLGYIANGGTYALTGPGRGWPSRPPQNEIERVIFVK
jgi:hypothetical protein